jgi:hypothetical protein
MKNTAGLVLFLFFCTSCARKKREGSFSSHEAGLTNPRIAMCTFSEPFLAIAAQTKKVVYQKTQTRRRSIIPYGGELIQNQTGDHSSKLL